MVDGKSHNLFGVTAADAMRDTPTLVDAACLARLTDRSLDVLRNIATPWHLRRVKDISVPWEDTVLPAWEIQLVGAVRLAAHNANVVLDAVALWQNSETNNG